MKTLFIEVILALFITFVYCGDCNNFKASFTNEETDGTVYQCIENKNGKITTLDVYAANTNLDVIETIGSFTTLKNLTLEISSASIDITPLKDLKNLVEFNLNGGYDFYNKRKNKLIGSDFSNFKKLKKLYLGDYVFTQDVLDDFANLSSVEDLVFYGIIEENVLEAIGSLSSLKTLFVYVRSTDRELDLSPLNKLEYFEKLEMECRVHKVRSTHYSFANNSVGGLKHLKSMTLYGFSFSEHTAEDISNMESIEELTFRRCQYFEGINFEPLGKLNDHLKTLTFSGYYYFKSNMMTEFPAVTSLTKLKELYVSNTAATVIPEEIGNLKSLEKLSIGSSDITEIPSSFSNLKNLKQLKFYGSNVVSIPEGIFSNLVNLEQLDISSNLLQSLPSDITNNKNLQYLDISGNIEINNINLKNMKNLKTLYLSNLQLKEIPTWLKKLSLLEFLDLSYNELSTVDKSIGNLTNLTTLDLSGNVISALPSNIKKLTNLLYLYVNQNSFTSIPQNVKYLTNLVDINFDSNLIETIPDFISGMTNLKAISLDYNKITTIPTSLSKLVNLEELYLNDNQISELPNIFDNMDNFKVLELKNNNFTSYPTSICEVKRLSELNFVIDYNYIVEETMPDCYSNIYYFSDFLQSGITN